MRIVHLIARLNDGGPARVLAEWCRESMRLGHEVRIVCGHCAEDEPDIGPQLIAAGLCVDYLPELGRMPSPLRDLKSLRAITRYLRKFQPDILHTHTAKAGILGRLCARYLSLPCLYSYHGHVLHGYWPWYISAAITWAERVVARRGHCHSLTRGLVTELRDSYGIGQPQRWHCLPIPVPVLSPSSMTRQAIAAQHQCQGWSDAVPTIGFLGRLVPVKDPGLFIQAAALVAAEQPLQVVIAGDGALRDQVHKALAELPSNCRAWSLGFVPASEALALMDVLVLSSRNEGTPLTIIEAGSIPVPVVATKVGGIKDLADSHFLLRVERKAERLAAGIRQQLACDRSACEADAAELVGRYSPSLVVPHYIRLYQRIAFGP